MFLRIVLLAICNAVPTFEIEKSEFIFSGEKSTGLNEGYFSGSGSGIVDLDNDLLNTIIISNEDSQSYENASSITDYNEVEEITDLDEFLQETNYFKKVITPAPIATIPPKVPCVCNNGMPGDFCFNDGSPTNIYKCLRCDPWYYPVFTMKGSFCRSYHIDISDRIDFRGYLKMLYRENSKFISVNLCLDGKKTNSSSEAKVICRSLYGLNFGGKLQTREETGYYSFANNLSTYADFNQEYSSYVRCDGSENNIINCRHELTKTCPRSDNLFVSCDGPDKIY